MTGGKLLPLVYTELRRIAGRQMARERAGQTLQPTALVHEAWLRLDAKEKTWANRAHFLSAAAEAMRRILIERARRRHAARHGGGHERLDIEEVDIMAPAPDDELLAINEVLDLFAAHDLQKAELVKLRYFAGFTLNEAADALGISIATAKRYWIYSRAWLFREIQQAKVAVPPAA